MMGETAAALAGSVVLAGAYVMLYLLFELAKYGAPKIHSLLPLGPEPLETLFILLLLALSASYLLQIHLARSPGLQDDYLGFAVLFLVYNFLAGADVVEEAHAGLLNLGFYLTALAAMPVIGCALAVGFALPEGALYGMLALIAGSTVINVVRHELPSPKHFRSGAFIVGVIIYAALIIATWRF